MKGYCFQVTVKGTTYEVQLKDEKEAREFLDSERSFTMSLSMMFDLDNSDVNRERLLLKRYEHATKLYKENMYAITNS